MKLKERMSHTDDVGDVDVDISRTTGVDVVQLRRRQTQEISEMFRQLPARQLVHEYSVVN